MLTYADDAILWINGQKNKKKTYKVNNLGGKFSVKS